MNVRSCTHKSITIPLNRTTGFWTRLSNSRSLSGNTGITDAVSGRAVFSRILGIVLLVFLPFSAFSTDWTGPLPPIASGYGSWGNHATAAAEEFEIQSSGYSNAVTVYAPDDLVEAAPTVFFAPGWALSCETYGELLRFLVSKGYVVVCDDYGEDSGVIGDQLFDAFTEAADRFPNLVDTSRFGLIGHSAGAGLLGSLGYRLAVGEAWGADGKFIFSSAPWIDFDITEAMLSNYPTDFKVISQMYEDDDGTDLRTSIDEFESLSRIPDSEKDYVILRPAEIDGYSYTAGHSVIATGGDGYGTFDAMDSYGVFRLVEALAEYAFTGSETAREVTLGDGGDLQIDMGDLPDLISTDDPRPIPGQGCSYPCDIPDNPRADHCDDYDGELPAAVLISPVKHAEVLEPSPTFSWESVPTADQYFLQLRPLLPNGEPDWTVSFGENVSATDSGCTDGGLCSHEIGSAIDAGWYVWWIKGYGNGLESVWSRRGIFREGGEIFSDGFESGETGAWSSVSP